MEGRKELHSMYPPRALDILFKESGFTDYSSDMEAKAVLDNAETYLTNPWFETNDK